ncbi:MAG TPA: hypothetical protein VII16_08320 [Actinomycetes bacterium]|jgi:hypothetical protein
MSSTTHRVVFASGLILPAGFRVLDGLGRHGGRIGVLDEALD